MNVEDITNLDVLYFGYTTKKSTIKKCIMGISVPQKEERYVTTAVLNPEDNGLFKKMLEAGCSTQKRTITFDYRLINKEMVSVLEWAYSSEIISGIRIAPNHAVLSKEKFDLLNTKSFTGFILAVNSISKDIDTKTIYLDLRIQFGLCNIEHVEYETIDSEYKKNDNIHITKELSKSDVHSLTSIIRKNSYNNIIVEFYKPSYYKRFLDYLSMENIPKNINIVFLGNPLYDDSSCFECFKGIIKNPVLIKYNTSNLLNSYYREEPHSLGIRYYLDYEVSGMMVVNHYYEMLLLEDRIIDEIKSYSFSPLEKIIYVRDYLKSHYDYDPNFQEASHVNQAHLDYVYKQDKVFQEGLAGIVSTILRRVGIPCYVYSSSNIKKNIIRVIDPKYQIDNIAIMDIHEEMKNNKYSHFLVPIDDELYIYKENALGRDVSLPEVINVPTSLCISTEDYYEYINDSNPIRVKGVIEVAISVLQKLGLSAPNIRMDLDEEIEYYKSALFLAKIKRKIPYDLLASAIHNVRERCHEYSDEYEAYMDYEKIINIVNKRGYLHLFDPMIKLFNGENKTVKLYSPSLDVDFVEKKCKTVEWNRPRGKKENETNEDFTCYLESYYDTILNVKYKERIKMDKVKEFKFEDEKHDSKYGIITIFMDQDDMGRTFVTADVLRRFHLERPMLKLTLDTGDEIYEIEQESVNYIIDHQNNKYAPYAVMYQLFNFENELQDEFEGSDSDADGFDEINIFRDVDNNDRVFVPLGVVERFHLDTFGDVVKLDTDTTIYEISIVDAINIAANRNNKYAPYRINYVDIQFTPATAESLMPYNEEEPEYEDFESDNYEDDLMPYDDDLSTIKEEEDVYARDIVEPRPRYAEESVRDYKIYLEGYYDGAYANMGITPETMEEEKEEEKLIPGTSFKNPRKKGSKESEEEYEEYLKTFYGRIFGAVENINKLGSGIIKRRPQREDESDAEYNQWLAEQNNIPVVETPLYAEQ